MNSSSLSTTPSRWEQTYSLGQAARFLGLTLLLQAVVLGGLEWAGVPDQAFDAIKGAASFDTPAAQIQWVESPENPFLEAACSFPDPCNGLVALARWKNAGLPAGEVPNVLMLTRGTLPGLLGRKDAVLQKEWETLAKDSVAALKASYPNVWAALRRNASAPMDRSQAFLLLHRAPEWSSLLTQPDLLEGFASLGSSEGEPPVTWVDARQALEVAVQETGLRSVRLPIQAFFDPAEMMTSAHRLRQINAELQQATGWKGGVLGLNGTVELTLQKPSSPGIAGEVSPDASGRLQMMTRWGAVAHEWFHAYDFVVQRTVFRRSMGHPLSDDHTRAWWSSESSVVDSMGRLVHRLKKDAPTWEQQRRERDALRETPYWTNNTEALAYAFEAMLWQRGLRAGIADPDRQLGGIGYIDSQWPLMEETALLDAAFAEHFQATARLELGVRHRPVTSPWVDPSSRRRATVF